MFVPTAATVFAKVPRTLRRHRLMTAWMRVTGEDPLQLVRIRGEAFAYADMRDGFLRLIVIDGNFESDFFAIGDALLKNGGVFLDVGANHGLMSFGLADKYADTVEFHLFEPNPTLISSIERSRQLYPTMKCTLNPSAVCEQSGVVRFHIDDAQTGASHIDLNGLRQVQSITVDDYLATEKVGQVTLLKLDVEGSELSVLRGARGSLERRAIRAIYFEYFEKWLSRVQPPGELIKFLHSEGYEACFCREFDIARYGGATHTVGSGLPGHGVPLLPIEERPLPPMTDLLAIPKEDLHSL